MSTAFRTHHALIAAVLAAPAAAQVEYTVIDLGQPPGDIYTVQPGGLNNLGEVVGWAHLSGEHPPVRAWKWTPSTGMVLLPPLGFENSAAVDINDAGVIAGDAGTPYAEPAWRFENGAYTTIPLPPGATWSTLAGINAGGDVVGYAGDFSPPGGDLFFHSDETGIVVIPNPAGTVGVARLNDLRQVAGSMNTDAVLWSPGGGFQTLGDPPGFICSGATAVNNNGVATGSARNPCHPSRSEKVVWLYTDGVWEVIVDLAKSPRGESPRAINSSAVVVGASSLPPGVLTAWVWSRERGVRLLNDIVDPPGPPGSFYLYQALDINDAGQILAEGRHLGEGLHAAFLLTPIGPPGGCAADFNDDGEVTSDDFFAFLAAFFEGTADFNGDGGVDSDDFFSFLAAFFEGCA